MSGPVSPEHQAAYARARAFRALPLSEQRRIPFEERCEIMAAAAIPTSGPIALTIFDLDDLGAIAAAPQTGAAHSKEGGQSDA